RTGDGVVAKDLAKAREWYDKAAEQGMAGAQTRLADTYYYDQGDGSQPDYALAYRYYLLAANQKHPDGLYGMGQLHDGVLGVPADRAKALGYFTQAADVGQVQALGYLGAAYLNGDKVEVDYAKALAYLQRGADLDDAFSLTNLGYMYEQG